MTIPIYDVIGNEYATQRRADARIAALINRGLDGAVSVLNVGAGAGSYEPTDRYVVALDPSSIMLAQRPRGTASAVQGRAEALPFADHTYSTSSSVYSHCTTGPTRSAGCASAHGSRVGGSYC